MTSNTELKALVAELEEQNRIIGARAARFAAQVAKLEEEGARKDEAIRLLTERAEW